MIAQGAGFASLGIVPGFGRQFESGAEERHRHVLVVVPGQHGVAVRWAWEVCPVLFEGIERVLPTLIGPLGLVEAQIKLAEVPLSGEMRRMQLL